MWFRWGGHPISWFLNARLEHKYASIDKRGLIMYWLFLRRNNDEPLIFSSDFFPICSFKRLKRLFPPVLLTRTIYLNGVFYKQGLQMLTKLVYWFLVSSKLVSYPGNRLYCSSISCTVPWLFFTQRVSLILERYISMHL